MSAAKRFMIWEIVPTNTLLREIEKFEESKESKFWKTLSVRLSLKGCMKDKRLAKVDFTRNFGMMIR
jgi:hypothetical protein